MCFVNYHPNLHPTTTHVKGAAKSGLTKKLSSLKYVGLNWGPCYSDHAVLRRITSGMRMGTNIGKYDYCSCESLARYSNVISAPRRLSNQRKLYLLSNSLFSQQNRRPSNPEREKCFHVITSSCGVISPPLYTRYITQTFVGIHWLIPMTHLNSRLAPAWHISQTDKRLIGETMLTFNRYAEFDSYMYITGAMWQCHATLARMVLFLVNHWECLIGYWHGQVIPRDWWFQPARWYTSSWKIVPGPILQRIYELIINTLRPGRDGRHLGRRYFQVHFLE